MFPNLLILLFVLLNLHLLLLAGPSQIAFIKDGQVYVASGEGTSVRQLTFNPSIKRMPKWSPKGTEVAYWEVQTSSTSLGTLVVIRADNGKRLGRFPVATVTRAGVRIEGMRAIERIGWFSNEDLFAEGEINPYIEEYRIINLRTGGIRSSGGFGFSTCAARGDAAFWEAVYPQQTSLKLSTTETKGPLFEFPKANELPTLNVPITWSNSCGFLAFIDARPPAHLVVISPGNGTRRTISLPDGPDSEEVKAWGQGFLIGVKQQLLYEGSTSTVEHTPTDVLEKLDKISELQRHVSEVLGGSEFDWWPSQ